MTERVQTVLVGFQLLVLALFVVLAFVGVTTGSAPHGVPFSPDWFNPFSGLSSHNAVIAGVATSVFYVVTAIFSERILYDTIAALGIMICWYYGITAFACAWHFRREVFSGVRSFLFKMAFPLLGGVMSSRFHLHGLEHDQSCTGTHLGTPLDGDHGSGEGTVRC